MTKNKILTAINGFLGIQFFGMVNDDGTPKLTTVLEGIPIGSKDGTSTGEAGIKAIIIGDNTQGLIIPPYDEQDFTYYGSTNNIETIVYKKATATVLTLTFTYLNSGAANDDLVTKIVPS